VYILQSLFSVVYPLFRSARIARGKECEENKIKLLKFWVINCFLHLLTYYLNALLVRLDVTDIALTCIYFILVVRNFQYTEWIYDIGINELLGRNEKLLHSFFKYIRKIFESSVYRVLNAVKDIFFTFLAEAFKFLPAPAKTLLGFMGVEAFLQKSVNKIKEF